jgi:hypothetical protein
MLHLLQVTYKYRNLVFRRSGFICRPFTIKPDIYVHIHIYHIDIISEVYIDVWSEGEIKEAEQGAVLFLSQGGGGAVRLKIFNKKVATSAAPPMLSE